MQSNFFGGLLDDLANSTQTLDLVQEHLNDKNRLDVISGKHRGSLDESPNLLIALWKI